MDGWIFPLEALIKLDQEGKVKLSLFPSLQFLCILLSHLKSDRLDEVHLKNDETHPCRLQ